MAENEGDAMPAGFSGAKGLLTSGFAVPAQNGAISPSRAVLSFSDA